MTDKTIYLDHGATTPVAQSVIEEMTPFFREKFGNPSSLYSLGREAKTEALSKSRSTVASYLNADPKEIIFTSCATESNNLAIKGSLLNDDSPGGHLITTKVEHHSVLHAFQWLEDQGYDVSYLQPDSTGLIEPAQLEDTITPDTKLVSVMYANNEVGTIEPIDELGKICRKYEVPFHTDAVQAYGKIPLDLDHVDLLSASGHKIYGPKGVGILYKRKEIDLEPLLSGGGHESGLRSGTENTAGIVGFAAATELLEKDGAEERARQKRLRDRITEELLKLPDTQLNGHREKRLPNNVNVNFKFVEGESIVMKLDKHGIAASTGSACSSPNLEPSHVLLALGLPPAEAHGSLRVTLGRDNTEQQIDRFLEIIPEVISELRESSPFKTTWEG